MIIKTGEYPKYEIRKTVICPECEGEGIIQHPDWAMFWQQTTGATSVEQDLEWFRENGHPFARSYRDLPSEEVYCDECEGAGEIIAFIDLRQALEEIGRGAVLP